MSYVTAFIGTHITCIYLIEKGLYLDFRWNQLSAVIYSLACYLLLKYLIFLQLKESFFLIFFWAFYELQYLLNVSIFLKKSTLFSTLLYTCNRVGLWSCIKAFYYLKTNVIIQYFKKITTLRNVLQGTFIVFINVPCVMNLPSVWHLSS